MTSRVDGEYLSCLRQRALAALRAWRDRGREAATCLRSGPDPTAADQWLRQRGIAFHNFQALDAKARTLGLDLAGDGELQELWRTAWAEHLELAGLLDQAKLQLEGRFGRLRASRRNVEAFHSGTSADGCDLRHRLVKRA